MLAWLVLDHRSFMCKPSNFPQVTWTPGSHIGEELTKILTCNVMPTTIRRHSTAFGSTTFTICKSNQSGLFEHSWIAKCCKGLKQHLAEKGSFSWVFLAASSSLSSLYSLAGRKRGRVTWSWASGSSLSLSPPNEAACSSSIGNFGIMEQPKGKVHFTIAWVTPMIRSWTWLLVSMPSDSWLDIGCASCIFGEALLVAVVRVSSNPCSCIWFWWLTGDKSAKARAGRPLLRIRGGLSLPLIWLKMTEVNLLRVGYHGQCRRTWPKRMKQFLRLPCPRPIGKCKVGTAALSGTSCLWLPEAGNKQRDSTRRRI